MLEKIWLRFDKDGKPVFPTVFASPGVAEKIKRVLEEIETTPDLKRRHDEIIQRKKEEWYDRESSRKLVG